MSNSCPLLPQVPTTKTPSAYSVLHCPRRIPPNPGAGFTGSPRRLSASSVRAVFAQHAARRRRKNNFLLFPRTISLVFRISLFCTTIQLYKDLFCARVNELTSVVVKYRPLTRRRRHRPRENGGGKKIIKGDDEEGRSRSKSDGVARLGFPYFLTWTKLSLRSLFPGTMTSQKAHARPSEGYCGWSSSSRVSARVFLGLELTYDDNDDESAVWGNFRKEERLKKPKGRRLSNQVLSLAFKISNYNNCLFRLLK